MDLSLVIPTYNEKDNIVQLINRLQLVFKENKINGEIIVVDDNSPDKTGLIVDKLALKNKNIQVIHRKGKLGLSSAVLEGWKISKGNILGVMDADLSHPPEKVKEMVNIILSNNADFVVGSRYIPQGNIIGWNLKRKIMSRFATLLARFFTSIKDPMSGFFMIKRSCLDIEKLNPKGFKILLEVALKSKYQKVIEVPITFVNRTIGESKAGINEIFYYLQNLSGYLSYKKNFFYEFLKFSLVGALGTIINIFILYSFTEIFLIYYLFSAIFAFFIAMTSNFILNKLWTFREQINYKISKKYFKFFLVSILALIVNLTFLYIFTEIFNLWYIFSQIFAIGISLIINFIGNKLWTFKR